MPSNYRGKSTKKPRPAPRKPAATKVRDYPREGKHPTGPVWERIRASVLAYHHGVCHLCGHVGALQADHIVPYTEKPELAMEPANLRPAHGTAGRQSNPCPTCGLNCNNIRGMGSIERAKRIISKRQGKEPVEDGREW